MARKVKLRIQNVLSGGPNPDISLTPLGKQKEDKFNAFDEKNGGDLGDYYDYELMDYGFTRKQLVEVRKKGTVNFVVVKK